MRDAAEGGMVVRFAEGAHGEEGYRIAFAESEVTVEAASRSGYLYGLITLGQILRGAQASQGISSCFPARARSSTRRAWAFAAAISTSPRQFYSSAEIGRSCILAWNKLNRFHWHLTEDEAWRIEIEAYPQLTEIAPGAAMA